MLPNRLTGAGILPVSSLSPSPLTVNRDRLAAHLSDDGMPFAEPSAVNRMSAGDKREAFVPFDGTLS